MIRSLTRFCLISFIITFLNIFALSWRELKSQIESKYKEFSTSIKDLTIIMEVENKSLKEIEPLESKIFIKGEKYRMETKINIAQEASFPIWENIKNIYIFDGKELWIINSITGKQKISIEDWSAYQNLLNWWKNVIEDLKITGSEKIGDRICYILENKDKEEASKKIWIDQKEHTLIQIEEKDKETTKILNSNFKKIKNWEVPYTTEVFVNGELMLKNTIKSLEINKNLSDELFDVDKAERESKINIQDLMDKIKIEN
ncbi:MAG: hypothetical protein ABIN61_08570 [candidate division WOR-3 bacterium]